MILTEVEKKIIDAQCNIIEKAVCKLAVHLKYDSSETMSAQIDIHRALDTIRNVEKVVEVERDIERKRLLNLYDQQKNNYEDEDEIFN